MNLHLLRHTWSPTRTLGTLYIDGAPFCFTLEDADRWLIFNDPNTAKIPGLTAIPISHSYEIAITWSPRFQKLMPLLLNVPYFEGVRIHAGNTEADTEGCILVGSSLQLDRVLNSRATYDPLVQKIKAGTREGRVTLSMERGKVPETTMLALAHAWGADGEREA